MTIAKTSTLSDQSELQGTFQISANGTDFFISIKIINPETQRVQTITKQLFNNLTFESLYKSPFVTGHLQLKNQSQQNSFNVDEYTPGTGTDIIKIHISQQSALTRCQRMVLVDKIFILSGLSVDTSKNNQMLNYYFADLHYGALSHTKQPWSTNEMLNIPSLAASYLSSEQKKVKVSDAILDLISTFCDKTKVSWKRSSHGWGEFYSGGLPGTLETMVIEGESVIGSPWHPSITTVEYTLKRNQSPINALSDLMNQYVSMNDNDGGLLLKSNGKFKLISLTTLFETAARVPAASIRIQTDDIRVNYSKREADSYFSRQGLLLIPVHIKDVTFYPKQPTAGTNIIVNHTISSYNPKSKEFNIYNNAGSMNSINTSFNNMTKHWPDAETRQLNNEQSIGTAANRHTTSISSTSSSDQYLSKTKLQQKIIDNADKITFNIPGNLSPTGGKFIGIELSGKPINKFMRSAAGLWFILQNTTTLTDGGFNSFLACSKLDKEKV